MARLYRQWKCDKKRPDLVRIETRLPKDDARELQRVADAHGCTAPQLLSIAAMHLVERIDRREITLEHVPAKIRISGVTTRIPRPPTAQNP